MQKHDPIEDESQPLHQTESEFHDDPDHVRLSASASDASTTSFVLEHLSTNGKSLRDHPAGDVDDESYLEQVGLQSGQKTKPSNRSAKRLLYLGFILAAIGWTTALVTLIASGAHKHFVSRPHDPHATVTHGNGKQISLEQVLTGAFSPKYHSLSWTAGPEGDDGLLLRRGEHGRDYLVVEDVRHTGNADAQVAAGRTLMKSGVFKVDGQDVRTTAAWPSPDHKYVLVQSDRISNYRHSSSARYWVFNVEKQTAEPLDSKSPGNRIQLAKWSPNSDSIVFTSEDNNMYIRSISGGVSAITTDGGTDLFYGVPDWVYEEEVLHDAVATWWSRDGKYIAFLRTNEEVVPTFPVQYFFSQPQGVGVLPSQGENYPRVRRIKYPKAGAPMSTVEMMYYDVENAKSFSVKVPDDFADKDRIIQRVTLARDGQFVMLVHNRVSDHLKIVLVDPSTKSAQVVREEDVAAQDGGWIESHRTLDFVPADPAKGRPEDGYIDALPHNGFVHLTYFSPVNSTEGLQLTQGDWEVVGGVTAIDLKHDLVYFVSTKKASTERHLYSVKLDGTDLKEITDSSETAYYSVSFSDKSGFMLLSYEGPGIPYQRVQSIGPGDDEIDHLMEDNTALRKLVEKTELPLLTVGEFDSDGFKINYVERRPPHFDPSKQYPVLFQLYNGPGFQAVDHRFEVDFQSYVVSNLGYISITIDGRGTGYKGRKHRCIIRDNIGHYEARDQIAGAKMFAKRPYIDADRLAIWGWSYGGFTTLKTLEQDAGQTFRYGIAVAPVTDWRYYDSVYTERYMHTPQENPSGYKNATISNMTALSQNVRFLVMHGASDDNVHTQNTLSLLDKLDQAGVSTYDMHLFPDSDHSVYFHNGHRIIYNSELSFLDT